MRRLVLLLVLGAGCPERATSWTEDPPGQLEPRFVGEWRVDQPAHALYESSWYRFDGDGGLEMTHSCTAGGPADYQTGTVQNDDLTVSCAFGAGWSSAGQATLLIDGECDDGAARQIVLGFPADASGNAAGLSQTQIDVVSVGGEPNWAHRWPEWRWTKCLEDCPPDFCLP
jgi:hypothetical protein